MINARSLFNKCNDLTEMLHTINPDICLVSETFETGKRRLTEILESTHYTHYSYYRKNRAPGGGCAVLFNQKRFRVEDLEVEALPEIENTWVLLTPKSVGQNCNIK